MNILKTAWCSKLKYTFPSRLSVSMYKHILIKWWICILSSQNESQFRQMNLKAMSPWSLLPHLPEN